MLLTKDVKQVFDKAYEKFGADKLGEIIGLSQPSISAVKNNRQGLTANGMELLCKAMNEEALFSRIKREQDERINANQQLRDKRCLVAMADFNLLSEPHKQQVQQFILELREEELFMDVERRLLRALPTVTQKEIEEYDAHSKSFSIVLDAICRFGKTWIMHRIAVDKSTLEQVAKNKKNLPKPDRELLIRYICAYDKKNEEI